MNKHCKGCTHHHNAGHKKDSILSRVYNDWCCKQGKSAVLSDTIGHCKNKNLKEIIK